MALAPNILLLFMDDHGWGDSSVNAPNVTETPSMLRLASQGVTFADFHVAASVCTPSRAGLLTGRYGLRTGVTSNFSPYSSRGMALTEHTMADMLTAAGYDSCIAAAARTLAIQHSTDRFLRRQT